MVYYLDLDYLTSAIDVRKQLLAKCLITTPQHLDKVECLLNVRTVTDEKYRTPWTKAKSDKQFFLGENQAILKDLDKLCSLPDITQQELYESHQNEDKVSSVSATFDLDCDIIPSSNPSSSETLWSSCFDQECGNIFQENFAKQDLKTFSTSLEEFKLGTLVSKDTDEVDCVADTRNLFTLKALVSKLQQVATIDPLVAAVKLSSTERYSSDNGDALQDGVSTLEADHEAGILEETFDKETIDFPTEELEEVILTDDFPGDLDIQAAEAALTMSAVLLRTGMAIQEELSIKSAFKRTFHPEPECENRLETLDSDTVVLTITTFLNINDAIDEEVDKFCDSAWLDSPVASSPEECCDLKVNNPTREPFEMSQSKPRLLTESQQSALTDVCLSSEYFLDKIQADRLPEPHLVDIELERDAVCGVKDIVRKFGLTADRGMGSLELDLPWELVKYSDASTISWRKLASLPPEESTSVLRTKTDTESTEQIQKYTSADMLGSFGTALFDDDLKARGELENISASGVATSIDDNKAKHPLKLPVKPRSSVYSLDPVGDFMAIRSKAAQIQKKTPVLIFPEFCENQNKAKTVLDKQPPIPKPECKRANKHHTVTVTLNDEFVSILEFIEETAAPYVHQLKKSGAVSSSLVFQSLTPDIAQFLVKQRKKIITDIGIEASSDDVYKAALCLYALSQASDYLKHCCLEAAIGFLCAVQEQFDILKKSILGSVLKKLVDKQSELCQSHVNHTKVAKLCKEVEVWLRKKRAKSGDNEQKILVLVKSDLPSLLSCLKNVLGNGNLLIPEILTSNKSEDILQSLDAHNCLIAGTRYVQELFPWAQFSLVVEYEYQPGSDWQQICQRQHIRHIGIQLAQESTHIENEVLDDRSSKFADNQICLIGSQETVTSNSDLLQLLEAKHNILLLERDYRAIAGQRDVVFSDLDVDENTCIVIHNLSDIQDDCSVQTIVRRLVALSMKYTKCFCLLSSIKAGSGYELPGHIITNLSHLKAATANLTAKLQDYSVQFHHCSEVGEMALLIRFISEQCMSEVPAASLQRWLDRSWLSQETTQKERFLLMIPCLSSCSAQKMLRTMDIQTLLTSSGKELLIHFPEMSQKTVETFCTHVNIRRGLQLQVDSSTNEVSEQASQAFDVPDRETGTACRVDDKSNDYLDFGTEEENRVVKSKRKFRHDTDSSEIPSELKKINNLRRKVDLELQVGHTNGTSSAPRTLTLHAETSQTNSTNDTRNEERLHKTSWNNLDKFVANRNPFSTDEKNIVQTARGTGKTSNSDFVLNNFDQEIVSNYVPSSTVMSDETNRCPSLYGRNRSLISEMENRPKSVVTNPNQGHQNQYLPVETQTKGYPTSYIYTERALGGNDGTSSRHAFNPHGTISSESNGVQPLETFDYNHGLSYKEASIPYSSSEQMSRVREIAKANSDSTHLQPHISEFLREFPSAVDVDSMNDLPSCGNYSGIPDYQTHGLPTNMVLRQTAEIGTNDYSALPNSMVDTAWQYPSVLDIDSEVQRESLSKGFRGNTARFQAYSEDDSYLKDMPTASENLSRSGEFHWRPLVENNDNVNDEVGELFSHVKPGGNVHDMSSSYFKDKSNPNSELQNSTNHTRRVFINPTLERVSLKPSFIADMSNKEPVQRKDFATSLADDLRETTRRLLENSQQFSKLDGRLVRRPEQKVNIGRATPLPRKPREGLSEATIRRERKLMEQSQWATESSPPMDLDDDTCFGALQHSHNEEVSNRAVFNYQTPKKRKLTYQRVPGRKGQTKLIFS